jgi:hypothetical protein
VSRRKRGQAAKGAQAGGAANRAKRLSRDGSRPDINTEIRRLQRTAALLNCMQVAAAEDTDVDMADALDVICRLIDESLQGLDRLELTTHGGGLEPKAADDETS